VSTARDPIELLRHTSSATVATLLFKRGLRRAAMVGPRRLRAGEAGMVGEAYTVRTIPSREDLDQLTAFDGRERLQGKAFDSCPAGHVFVVDCRGQTGAAFGGAVFLSRLAARSAAGFVSDGAVRDVSDLATLRMPVFAAGTAPPPSPVIHHVADINVAIGCGGVAVYPGDIVVGDADGVVVIPRDIASEIAQAAVEQERFDQFALEQLRSGRAVFGLYPPDEAMRARYEEWRKKQG
jgi:regulator of RNase E activity RraA